MRRFTIFLFIFIIAVAPFGCKKVTEEDKVREVIADVQKAAEEKDSGRIIDHVSKAYSDPQGLKYENIHKMLRGYFFVYPKISVYITNLDVSVRDTSARAMFHAVLTSGSRSGSIRDVLPQSLGMYNFDVSLEKESGKWKVTSAAWTHAEMNGGESENH